MEEEGGICSLILREKGSTLNDSPVLSAAALPLYLMMGRGVEGVKRGQEAECPVLKNN